ncbi:DUF4163 domain-containing protein [Caldicellulosiruptor bescii]|uniref:Uncharacterized protein n=3 Tax=Caldicellulosiruptor bescii TaxID=31899 RepID=B9MQ40_CALBD|nr:DUF4163 domain-containing protein [Caldicellulosiruptor bescii]ACM59832.1 hypothetical protein Athe_0717 [Caldicellulosiruptor bescii DSM 6725]SKC63874.1 protein of unknown function [Caldicellulosiruptor bescii]SKC66026.1 protein of unknown function [Caldicellulosiruptor bescii]SLL40146.1 protein of unknown function [Caldicellulosiruptor bescii]SMR92675.1 protein of unknown function [Caldicellulosiruptor bescii]
MIKGRMVIVCIFILLLLSITGCSVFKTKKESISKVNTSTLQKSNQAIKYLSDNKATSKPTWDVVFERIYQTTERYEIDIYVPKITGSGLKQEVSDKINSFLREYIDQRIEDIKKITESPEDNSSFYPYILAIKCEWDKSVSPYISFLFEEYSYTGGAHGMTHLESFTFNLETGDNIRLESLLNNEQKKLIQNYVNIERTISKDLFDPFSEELGGKEDFSNSYQKDFFDDMIFKNKGYLICFEPYKIGPYSSGVVKFWFGLDELEQKGVNADFDLKDYSTIKRLLSMNLGNVRKEFGLPIEVYSSEGGFLYETKSGLTFSFTFDSVENWENISMATVNSIIAGNNIKLFGISIKSSLSDVDEKIGKIKEIKKNGEGIDEEWGSYLVSYEVGEDVELYIESKTEEKNSEVSYILIKKKGL